MATKTLSNGKVDRLDAQPDFRKASTRLTEIQRELARLEDLEREARQKRIGLLEKWKQDAVDALAEGKPEPPPPPSLIPNGLLSDRERYTAAAGQLRRQIEELGHEHSRKLRGLTLKHRAALVKLQIERLASLADAVEDAESFQMELAEAGCDGTFGVARPVFGSAAFRGMAKDLRDLWHRLEDGAPL